MRKKKRSLPTVSDLSDLIRIKEIAKSCEFIFLSDFEWTESQFRPSHFDNDDDESSSLVPDMRAISTVDAHPSDRKDNIFVLQGLAVP